MAFVAMLENLTPLERAVFILREAFDFKHKEIAEVIDKNESHCRQLDRRARDKLHYKKAQFDYEEQSHQQLLLAFVAACANGDLDKLADLLAEDVVAYSDGGGKVIAALRPLVGRERVLRFLNRTMNYAILGSEQQQSFAIEFCQVNGQQGIKMSENGQTVTVISFVFKEGRLQALHSMRNPDKLI